ncbi:MAG: signal peptidase I [Clostridia bacterium]|nr:signal peptidase I [Clostridia bacterium]
MKKILNVLWSVFVVLVVIVAVSMMVFTIVSVNMFDRTNRDIFGYKFFIAQSDSMSATDFSAGDIVIVKEVDAYSLKEGDVITFVSQNSYSYGETVTHKIREVRIADDGSIGFVTYGTTTNTDDEVLATIIIGKYVGKLPFVGTFFTFLKTTPGYILCILTPFLILIISQVISTVRLFRQYKKEQTAEIEAERAKLQQEREESQKMMAELLALKAQLESQSGANTNPASEENGGDN